MTAMSAGTGKSQDFYADAGAIANSIISSIRTVVAFGGEERGVKQYNEKLDDAMKAGMRKSVFQGAGIGLVMLIMFNTYALAFWSVC